MKAVSSFFRLKYYHNRFFTGREYDADLQQYYYRARWYSPALGRFTSRDPIGYSEGPNLYAYVDNNPTTFVDPRGTEKQVLPNMTNDFIMKLVGAGLQSNELDRIYDKKEYGLCKAMRGPFNCLESDPTASIIYMKDKYYDYYVYAFEEWDYKKTDYSPKKLGTNQLKIGNQTRNHDDPGNFLIGYTVAASDISLDLIGTLSYIDAIKDISLEQIGNYTNVRNLGRIEHFTQSFNNEFNDQYFIQMGFAFYQRYGLTITPERLTSFLDND